MAKKGETKCPDCDGAGTVQGYYTMPPHDCDTCGGTGSVKTAEAVEEPDAAAE